MDKFSYAIGLGIGQNLLSMGAQSINVQDRLAVRMEIQRRTLSRSQRVHPRTEEKRISLSRIFVKTFCFSLRKFRTDCLIFVNLGKSAPLFFLRALQVGSLSSSSESFTIPDSGSLLLLTYTDKYNGNGVSVPLVPSRYFLPKNLPPASGAHGSKTVRCAFLR